MKFLFERDSHETRSNESVTGLLFVGTLDVVRNCQLNRPHLTIIASTNSFRVRERRLIVFGQNYVGRGVLFWAFGKVESRVDELRHLLFTLICRNVLMKEEEEDEESDEE